MILQVCFPINLYKGLKSISNWSQTYKSKDLGETVYIYNPYEKRFYLSYLFEQVIDLPRLYCTCIRMMTGEQENEVVGR